GVLGITGASPCLPPAMRPVAPPEPPASRLPSILRQWDEARPLTGTCPASRYLAGRGLALENWPADLRCYPALPYWIEASGKPVVLCRLPALLALVRDKSGEIAGLHRTWLDGSTGPVGKARLVDPATGEYLPARKLASITPGATTGAAIRLAAPGNGRLGLAEGIETALACHLASGLPVWSCISAHGLESVRLPDDVPGVWIFGDHDTSGTGQQAAHRLAARLHGEGRQVRVLLPSRPGMDWCDVLNTNEGGEA
ncbi:MAG: toprim domain-containing protein, partial [Laribacter sp.]|nr:toprim domain-containing protein [Laribacter sp.]